MGFGADVWHKKLTDEEILHILAEDSVLDIDEDDNSDKDKDFTPHLSDALSSENEQNTWPHLAQMYKFMG